MNNVSTLFQVNTCQFQLNSRSCTNNIRILQQFNESKSLAYIETVHLHTIQTGIFNAENCPVGKLSTNRIFNMSINGPKTMCIIVPAESNNIHIEFIRWPQWFRQRLLKSRSCQCRWIHTSLLSRRIECKTKFKRPKINFECTCARINDNQEVLRTLLYCRWTTKTTHNAGNTLFAGIDERAAFS